MPLKSQAQRGFLNAHFGHEWTKEHHYDQTGKLPYHVRAKMAAGGLISPAFGAVASKPYQAMPPGGLAPVPGPAPVGPPPMPGPAPVGPPPVPVTGPSPAYQPGGAIQSAPDVRTPIQAHTMPAIGPVQYPGPPRFPTPDGRDGYQGANRLRKLATGRPGAIGGGPGRGFNSYYMPRGFQGSSPMRRPMAKGGVVHGAVIPASYHMNEGGGPKDPAVYIPKKKGFHWRP